MKQKKEEIRQLLAANKLEEAFDELLSMFQDSPQSNELVLQSASFHRLKEAKRKGSINWEKAQTAKNQIIDALLQILNTLDTSKDSEEGELTECLDHLNEVIPTRSKSLPKWRYYLLIPLLIFFYLSASFVYTRFNAATPAPLSETEIKWKDYQLQLAKLNGHYKTAISNPESPLKYQVKEEALELLGKYRLLREEIYTLQNFSPYWEPIVGHDLQVLHNMVATLTTDTTKTLEYARQSSMIGEWALGTLEGFLEDYHTRQKPSGDLSKYKNWLEKEEVVEDVKYQLLISLGIQATHSMASQQTQEKIQVTYRSIPKDYIEKYSVKTENPIIASLISLGLIKNV